MNKFMFHSLEFIQVDEIIIYGSWGDYSLEVKINSNGVEVLLPDFDNEDSEQLVAVRKIFKEEFLKENDNE